jgi:hypothetical protein
VNFHVGSSKTTLIIVLVGCFLLFLIVVGREIHKALHPRAKPMRKRKRRTF